MLCLFLFLILCFECVDKEHRYLKISAHKLKQNFLLLKEQNEKLTTKNNELLQQIKALQMQLEGMESMQATLQNQLSQVKRGGGGGGGGNHTPTASRSHSPTRPTSTSKKTPHVYGLYLFI